MLKENYLHKSIGDRVKERRMKNGISIAYASKALKIKTEYLQAIENNDFDKFPSEVYAKGFLRNYSNFLGMDSNLMVKLYKQEKLSTQDNETSINIKNDEAEKGFSFEILLSKNRILASSLLISAFVIILIFIVRILVNLNKPILSLNSPLVADAKEGSEFIIDINSPEALLRGEIGAGNTLYVNDDLVDTFGLSEFEIPLNNLPVGRSEYIISTQNQFGIESKIKLIVVRVET